jgi:hypothetical protein
MFPPINNTGKVPPWLRPSPVAQPAPPIVPGPPATFDREPVHVWDEVERLLAALDAATSR